MSPHRPPSPPPRLPGFEHVSLLGSGGFADVFLYRQELPSREVAVKVLLPGAVEGTELSDFTAEANVMAQLSTHPSIVTIYQAGVSDDRRPYLVMEYCPRPNLQVRYRKQRLSIAESLRIGIQVAGAVETSHRAGILHRDIKPANVLVTQYNRPALTDFGIAGTMAQDGAEAVGMSVPWAPPESFATPSVSVRQSDIWSLGATVYALAAGRSPFEIPGASNGTHDLIARIQGSSLPKLGRPDAPASLEAVLGTALAKSVQARYDTALAFARALQKVEIELGLSVTPVDVLDDSEPDSVEEDDDGGLTRISNVVSIAAQPLAPQPTTTRTPAGQQPILGRPTLDPEFVQPGQQAVDATVRRGVAPAATPAPFLRATPEAPPVGDTMRRELPAAEPEPESAGRPRKRTGMIVAAVVAGVIVLGAGAAVAASALHPAKPAASASSAPQSVVVDTVPAPTHVVGTVQNGSVVFTWSNPDPKSGDGYLWGPATAGSASDPTLHSTTQETVTVAAVSSGQTCIEVFLRRADGSVSPKPATGCAP